MGQKIVTALGKLIGQNWRYKDYRIKRINRNESMGFVLN
jgi:hypothetical protein